MTGSEATVLTPWKDRNVDHAVIFSVATRLEQVDAINSFIARVAFVMDKLLRKIGLSGRFRSGKL